MAEQPQKLLRRLLEMHSRTLNRELTGGRNAVNDAIRSVASSRRLTPANVPISRLRAAYAALDKRLDAWLANLVDDASLMFSAAADADADIPLKKGSITRVSRRYAVEQLAQLTPDKASSLIAVRTNKMLQEDISLLRQTVIDAMRRATLSDMTARELQKTIKTRMLEELVGGRPDWRFTDVSGRTWNTDNYFNMLLRTVGAKTARESYIGRLVENGEDLCTIEGGGDPCPACAKWRGVVVSLTGATDGFPTIQNAKDGGVFHPNCLCEPRFIAGDDPEVSEQRGRDVDETAEARDERGTSEERAKRREPRIRERNARRLDEIEAAFDAWRSSHA